MHRRFAARGTIRTAGQHRNAERSPQTWCRDYRVPACVSPTWQPVGLCIQRHWRRRFEDSMRQVLSLLILLLLAGIRAVAQAPLVTIDGGNIVDLCASCPKPQIRVAVT